MDFDGIDIPPELLEKAKACNSPEELIELAKSEGYKLSEADLEAMAGGKKACGDSRDGIDPGRVRADFVNGIVDGGELD